MGKFESFGDWVEKKWGSQTALAQEMGVAKNTVSQWVRGISRIKGESLTKIRDLGYDGPLPGEDTVAESLPEYGRSQISPEHVAEAYEIIFQAVGAAKLDIAVIDPKQIGLLVGLTAEEVAKGNSKDTRLTLVRRAEVLLGAFPANRSKTEAQVD